MSKQNGDRHSADIQPSAIQPEQLTAYALGQLRGEELAAVKAAVGEGGIAAAHDEVREVQALAAAIAAARNAELLPGPSVELRAGIESKLAQMSVIEKVEPAANQRRWRRPTVVEWAVVGGIGVLLLALCVPAVRMSRLAAQRAVASNSLKQLGIEKELQRDSEHRAVEMDRISRRFIASAATRPTDSTSDDSPAFEGQSNLATIRDGTSNSTTWRATIAGPSAAEQYEWTTPPTTAPANPATQPRHDVTAPAAETPPAASYGGFVPAATASAGGVGAGYGGPALAGGGQAGGYPGGASGLPNGYPGELSGSDRYGARIASNPMPQPEAKHFYQNHIVTETLPLSEQRKYNSQAELAKQLAEREVAEHGVRLSKSEYDLAYRLRAEQKSREFGDGDHVGSEQYEQIIENQFLAPTANPLSTFSIDVDTASYANVRRFLNEGRLPPPSAVRIEELVNYFTYSYPQPAGKEPFSVNMEAAECPWNAGHLLLRVGLKGKEIHRSERPPSNLTFLLDVSGSMADANKLPLLKATLMMFVAELTENDRVSIVTYAGEAGLRLPPTLGHEKAKIMAAIDSLSAGGSTHGSAGIQLAYEQAGQYFLKEGTNRVILATDGDLNVGVTSDDALVQLIKEKATGGTFLTVLGFGTGNLKDGKLEKLADNGNGVYAYIDGFREGRKVLVEQMSGSLVTIAKDVKIQIEFNPAQIASYRLLGYENRVLAAADFNNDKKDAGEIGAGHTVTALFELVPVGLKQDAAAPQPVVEPLKYQSERISQIVVGDVPKAGARELTEVAKSGELLTLKLRYKEPDGIESRLVEFPLKDRGGKFNGASKDLQFAAAVASFGMILRGSEHRGSGNLPAVAEIASGAIGNDPNGYRAEFVDLVRKAQSLGAK